jgi:hypothetical protein
LPKFSSDCSDNSEFSDSTTGAAATKARVNIRDLKETIVIID